MAITRGGRASDGGAALVCPSAGDPEPPATPSRATSKERTWAAVRGAAAAGGGGLAAARLAPPAPQIAALLGSSAAAAFV
jgi:hypothetical protein